MGRGQRQGGWSQVGVIVRVMSGGHGQGSYVGWVFESSQEGVMGVNPMCLVYSLQYISLLLNSFTSPILTMIELSHVVLLDKVSALLTKFLSCYGLQNSSLDHQQNGYTVSSLVPLFHGCVQSSVPIIFHLHDLKLFAFM